MIITEETKEILKVATEGTLNNFYPHLSSQHNHINVVNNALAFMKSKFDLDEESKSYLQLNSLKKTLEFNMLIMIFHLDLSVIVNIFLNGKSEYEKLFALKQGVVIINEGYKKIFNFVTINKDGSYNYTQRHNSFWNKEIRLIVNQYPALSTEFNQITEQLDDFYHSSFDQIKGIRDLTVHYDREPDKFYQMLTSLDTESIFNKMTGFVRIISKLYKFTQLVLDKISVDVEHEKDIQGESYLTTLRQFEERLHLAKGVDLSLKSETESKINELKRIVEKVFKKKNEA